MLTQTVVTTGYERFLIYPVRFNSIFLEEKTDAVIIELDSLEELKMISEGFNKPLLYDENYYIVVFSKDVHYRVKKHI